MIILLKVLISLIFIAAAWQKFSGKAAERWLGWGYSKQIMLATGVAEIVGVLLLLWPRFELLGASLLGAVMLGAIGTLIRHKETGLQLALPTVTLLLILLFTYLLL